MEVSPYHEEGSFSGCKFKTIRTDGQEFNCMAILIATGSNCRQLIVPGSETLLGVIVHYCATCNGFFCKNKHIMVIGGGNSAFEESLFLKEKFAKPVTVLIRGNEPHASPVLQEKVKDREGIIIVLNSEVTELIGKTSLETVRVQQKDTGEVKKYDPDGIFVFIGLSPNTKFLENVEMDTQGFLLTDIFQTSAQGIFVAGDC